MTTKGHQQEREDYASFYEREILNQRATVWNLLFTSVEKLAKIPAGWWFEMGRASKMSEVAHSCSFIFLIA